MPDNRDRWREAARRILKEHDIVDASVDVHANVHVMQDAAGAFVEAVIWVPARALSGQSKAKA